MKVWINKRCGDYEGGMIIVAANSAKEAHKTFLNDFDYNHLDDTYFSVNWQEVPNLIYNGDKPCVIVEHGYSE